MNIPSYIQAFEQCSSNLDYICLPEASIWIYKALKGMFKILIYSGDTDGCVPTYGTKNWIDDLGWEIQTEMDQWTTDGQLSGYIEQRDGMDFVTIHGVGHMAP